MSVEEVERAMHGDHDAFASVIAAAADRLYALACLILRDPVRAEDAVQEAVIRAWGAISRLRSPDRFDAWLRRLTINACYDEARRTQRRAEVGLPPVDIRSIPDATQDVADRDRIDRAFRRLPMDQRTVLILAHHFELSHAEIAETLGIPLGTVKSRARYGLAAMRASLEADDRMVAERAQGRTA